MRVAAAAYPLDWCDGWANYAAKLSDWVARGAATGAQLLVFPEYAAMELASLGGAAIAADPARAATEVMRHAARADALHASLAARHGVHILAGSGPAAASGTRPVNRAVLHGPHGRIGHQDKLIPTPYERDDWGIAAGAGLQLFDTALGRLGVLICYDAEFPLPARALVAAGAQILLVPSCTETPAGFTRVRVGAMARALEGQCIVVHAPTIGVADWCPPVDRNSGRAAIYCPPDLGFPDTGILAQTAPDHLGWAVADIDPGAVAQVRAHGAVRNHGDWAAQEIAAQPPVHTVRAPHSA